MVRNFFPLRKDLMSFPVFRYCDPARNLHSSRTYQTCPEVDLSRSHVSAGLRGKIPTRRVVCCLYLNECGCSNHDGVFCTAPCVLLKAAEAGVSLAWVVLASCTLLITPLRVSSALRVSVSTPTALSTAISSCSNLCGPTPLKAV